MVRTSLDTLNEMHRFLSLISFMKVVSNVEHHSIHVIYLSWKLMALQSLLS